MSIQPQKKNGSKKPLDTVVNFDEDFAADESSISSSNDDIVAPFHADSITMIKETSAAASTPKSSKGHMPKRGTKSRSKSRTKTEPEICAVQLMEPPEMNFEDPSWDSGLDDASLAEEDRLRLRNSRLEGRLSVVGSEAKTWLKDRSDLSAQISALHSMLKCSKDTYEKAMRQAEDSAKELIITRSNYDKELANLNGLLSKKSQDVDQLNKYLDAAREEQIKLKLTLQRQTEMGAGQDQSVSKLKGKIAELFTDVETLKAAHSQAIDSKVDLQGEIDGLKKSRDWYNDQLTQVKSNRDQMQMELKKLSSLLNDGSNLNHKLSHENACLHSQLVCSKAALTAAKRNNCRQLDAIRAQLIERESMFEQLAEERRAFEELSKMKAHQLQESQDKLHTLDGDLKTAYDEISTYVTQLDQVQAAFALVQSEKSQLEKLAHTLQANLDSHRGLSTELEEKHALLSEEMSRLAGELAGRNEQFDQLQRERDHFEEIIRQVAKEKELMETYLKELNSQLTANDSKLQQLESSLQERSEQLTQLVDTKAVLEEANRILEQKLVERLADLDALHVEKEAVDCCLTELQSENAKLNKSLLELRELLETTKDSMTREFNNRYDSLAISMTDQLAEVNSELADKLAEIDGLSGRLNELLPLQLLHQDLLKKHQDLLESFRQLQEQSLLSQTQSEAKQAELLDKIQSIEAHYEVEFQRKLDHVSSLTREAAERSREIEELCSEITTIKELQATTLNQQESQWSGRLAEIEQRMLVSEQLRDQATSQLAKTKQEAEEAMRLYAKEVDDHREQCEKLASMTTYTSDLEAKHKRLLTEFELVRGKQTGLTEAYETLRSHAKGLESVLSQKVAALAELEHRAEVQEREITFSKQISVECHSPTELFIRPTKAAVVSLQQAAAVTTIPESQPDNFFVQEVEIKRLEMERDQMVEAASLANKEAVESLASITVMRQEIETKTGIMEKQREILQETNRAKSQLTRELADVTQNVHRLQTQLVDVEKQLFLAREDNVTLNGRFTSFSSDYKAELESLRAIIRATSEHLKTVNDEMVVSQEQKRTCEGELARIRGEFTGMIERQKYLSSVDATVSPTHLTIEIADVERLLMGLSTANYLKKRPLVTVDEYMSELQSELNGLEGEIQDHTMTVHDSVDLWKSIMDSVVHSNSLLTED